MGLPGQPDIRELNGSLVFENFEHNLKLNIEFVKGQVSIHGSYEEGFANDCQLIFSISSDQSYFLETLAQLKESLINQYKN